MVLWPSQSFKFPCYLQRRAGWVSRARLGFRFFSFFCFCFALCSVSVFSGLCVYNYTKDPEQCAHHSYCEIHDFRNAIQPQRLKIQVFQTMILEGKPFFSFSARSAEFEYICCRPKEPTRGRWDTDDTGKKAEAAVTEANQDVS